jgi:peptidoglycan LD-endopeptidase CwlK
MPRFGAVSRANLAEVHPELQRLFNEVIKHWDCTILDGARTLEEQRKNVAKGVSQTMNSKHIGGRAVDAMPYPVDWNAIQRGLDAIKRADGGMQVAEAYMFQGFVAGMAAALGIKVRQGVDWDSDRDFANQTFHDLPHTELAGG